MSIAILLSGGIDSAVCLLRALDTGKHVVSAAVDYNQEHGEELISAAKAGFAEIGGQVRQILVAEGCEWMGDELEQFATKYWQGLRRQ